MTEYAIIGTVGRNGLGTVIHEEFTGTEADLRCRLKKINQEYNGFISLAIFEDGLKTYDSNWREK